MAWCWPKPPLVAKFRYLPKTNRYWTAWVKNEPRLRSKHGHIIPHQFIASFGLRNYFFPRAFLAVTPYWLSIEVPRGCGAQTPWVFTYFPEGLRDPQSGFWRVAYTKFVACVGAYILFEVYDNYPLCSFSRDMIRDIRVLDLVRVLGSGKNYEKLRRFVEVI